MLKCVLATFIAAAILQTPAQNPGSQKTILAVIDKVVLEPDDESPVRVQAWGTLNQQYPDMMVIKSEWRRVKAAAGTATVVQFQSSDVLPLHPETDWPIPPAVYPRGLRVYTPPVKQGLTRKELLAS